MNTLNTQNDKSNLWIDSRVYKRAFIKKHLKKSLQKGIGISIVVSLILVCLNPLTQSEAYTDTFSASVTTNTEPSKYNTGLNEQTERKIEVLLTEYENEEELLDEELELNISINLENEQESEDFSEIIPVLETITVPNWLADCKSYNITHMDYRAVTSKASYQYKLLNSNEAYTDESTGLRMINGRYAIALGLGFNVSVGDYVNIKFSNGKEFECIVGDIKDSRDTDSSKKFQKYDGSVVEAITDKIYFTGSKSYPDGFNGTIEQIIRLDKSYEFNN